MTEMSFIASEIECLRGEDARRRLQNVNDARFADDSGEVLAVDQDRWTLICAYSYDVVSTWKAPIDLLFIDGDHSYPTVRADFDQWVPHVRPGGVILLHDSRRAPGTPAHEFNQGWPGPTRLAEELRDDPRVALIEEAHSLTIWQVEGDDHD